MFEHLASYKDLSESDKCIFELRYRHLIARERKEILEIRKAGEGILPKDVDEATLEAAEYGIRRIRMENEVNAIISKPEVLKAVLKEMEGEVENSPYMKRRKEIYG